MVLQVSARTIVEAFLPFDSAIPLNLVYDAANQIGISDQTLRLSVRRLIASGDAHQSGRGRSGSLQLTDKGRQRLLNDRRALALAQAQDAGKARWDGTWHLMAVSVPEHHRTIRDSMRRRLTELGAAAISTGLYVSPHDLRDAIPAQTIPWLTTATTEDLNLRGLTDPAELAEELWPAHPIVASYQAADAAIQEIIVDPTMPDIVRRLYLAQAYESAMREDPLLPEELRRNCWEPAEIRRRWAQLWAASSTACACEIYQGWLAVGDESC